MSFHDRAVQRAIAEGRSSNDFKAGAQKNANAFWFWLLVAGGIWYFFGWKWAILPGAISIFKAIMSIDATTVASKIEKLGDNDRT